MDYDYPFFDDEPEYYHDAFGDIEKLEKQVGKPLTIAELKEFMNHRTHVTYDKEDMELLVDEKSGLLYTEELNTLSAEMLINHCLVEQCMEQRRKVDWKRVTDNYDYKLIEKIYHIYKHPLTWVYPPEEIGHDYLVWGLMAASKPCEHRYSCSTYYDFFDNLRELAIRWFAENLPTKNDIRGYGRDYHLVPNDMILWDRLCSSEHIFNSRQAIFNPQTLQKHIEFIAEKIGVARAAEIVRLLREDWQDIVIRKLFDIDELDENQVEEFRQNLFEGMDRSLRRWDSEASADTPSDTPSPVPVCRYIDLDKLASAGIHTPEQFTTMLRQACEQDAPSLAAFLRKNFKLGYLDFHGDKKKQIYEHLKECFPGAITYSYTNFTMYFT